MCWGLVGGFSLDDQKHLLVQEEMRENWVWELHFVTTICSSKVFLEIIKVLILTLLFTATVGVFSVACQQSWKTLQKHLVGVWEEELLVFLTYNRSSYLLDLYVVGDKWELLKLRSPFVQRLMQMTVIGGNSNQACNAPEPRVFETG